MKDIVQFLAEEFSTFLDENDIDPQSLQVTDIQITYPEGTDKVVEEVQTFVIRGRIG